MTTTEHTQPTAAEMTAEQAQSLVDADVAGRISKIGAKRVAWYRCPECGEGFEPDQFSGRVFGELLHTEGLRRYGRDVTGKDCYGSFKAKTIAAVIAEPWALTQKAVTKAHDQIRRELENAAYRVAAARVDRSRWTSQSTEEYRAKEVADAMPALVVAQYLASLLVLAAEARESTGRALD